MISLSFFFFFHFTDSFVRQRLASTANHEPGERRETPSFPNFSPAVLTSIDVLPRTLGPEDHADIWEKDLRLGRRHGVLVDSEVRPPQLYFFFIYFLCAWSNEPVTEFPLILPPRTPPPCTLRRPFPSTANHCAFDVNFAMSSFSNMGTSFSFLFYSALARLNFSLRPSIRLDVWDVWSVVDMSSESSQPVDGAAAGNAGVVIDTEVRPNNLLQFLHALIL